MWRKRLLVECMVDVSGDFEGLLGVVDVSWKKSRRFMSSTSSLALTLKIPSITSVKVPERVKTREGVGLTRILISLGNTRNKNKNETFRPNPTTITHRQSKQPPNNRNNNIILPTSPSLVSHTKFPKSELKSE